MVLLIYEHLEQIRCVFYFQSLLILVQLSAKLVGKIDSFFQYKTPELYTYSTFVLKKKTKERRISFIDGERGPKLLSRKADQVDYIIIHLNNDIPSVKYNLQNLKLRI